jgi:hypothetical protein
MTAEANNTRNHRCIFDPSGARTCQQNEHECTNSRHPGSGRYGAAAKYTHPGDDDRVESPTVINPIKIALPGHVNWRTQHAGQRHDQPSTR